MSARQRKHFVKENPPRVSPRSRPLRAGRNSCAGAPRRALGRGTSALPLTRWRSSALPMHRTASFPIHNVKQRSLLRSRARCYARVFIFIFFLLRRMG